MTRPLLAPLLLCCTAPLAAQDRHDLEPEDYFTLRAVGSLAASPDGGRVAYTLSGWEDDSEDANTDLWVVGGDGGNATRLTFDPASDSSPMWSADGGTIYFLSARDGGDAPPTDGETQVWRIDPDGRNLSAVTRLKGGVEAAQLAPADGPAGAIFYTVPREEVEDDLAGLRAKYKDLDYGHGVVKYSTLMRLDLSTWRSEQVAAPDRFIRTFAVSDDGKTAALVTDPDRNLISHEGRSRVDRLDVKSGEITPLTPAGWRDGHPSPFGWIDTVDLSETGKVLFTVGFDGYPVLLYVAAPPAAAAADGAWGLERIEAEDPVTIGFGAAEFVNGSDDVAFVGEDRGRARVYRTAGPGAPVQVVTPGDVVVTDFELTADSPPLLAAATPTELGDVWKYAGGDYVKLTDVNPHTDDWAFPEVRIYKWQSADGTPVEGILELPPGYQKEDGPLPTVIVIHGGPTAAEPYMRRFRIYGRSLLAAQGYAMLAPNYRGSTGYGEEFMVDLIGRENDIEVTDILAGAEQLVRDGVADPDKLGVMGWSNGGFLTNALLSETVTVTQPGGDREVGFAAASSGAGVVDQVIQWGTEDTPGHVVNYMSGKLPWEFPAEYLESSPLYDLEDTATPTLIHVGGSDARVPPAHSRTLYRALHDYLDVPAELIVYPGEPHGLMKKSNRAAKMAWDHAWFEKYLRGGEPGEE